MQSNQGAQVAKLVDAPSSGGGAVRCDGSNPFLGTKRGNKSYDLLPLFFFGYFTGFLPAGITTVLFLKYDLLCNYLLILCTEFQEIDSGRQVLNVYRLMCFEPEVLYFTPV